MEYKTEHQRQIAIIEAALPYIAPGNRHAIELFLQADSLVSLARNESPETEGAYTLEAAEHREPGTQTNGLQEMLLQIQEHLTPRESDMVQMVLNFLNAGRLLRRYREFNQNATANASLRDFLLAQLNPEQKASFEQLQSIMANEQS